MLNEADTRAKLIDPKLHESGWGEDLITREYYFTEGKVYLVGDEVKRKTPKKVDYLLLYNDAFPLAVVEAKEESANASDGMQQAKDYAQNLDVLFAYSTNGHEIEEFNFITNKQRRVSSFPSPQELFNNIAEFKKLSKEQMIALLQPYNKAQFRENPRYYQQISVRRALESIIRGQKRILINLATGTGKTNIAFQIAWKLKETKKIRRVLFLADRNVLRDQAYNTFEPFGSARDYIEEGKTPTARDVYFSIYQAMWAEKNGRRVFEHYPKDFFDLVIIDECHRSGFGSWKEILDHFSSAIHLGMTATPKQDENINTYKYFGDPANEYRPAYEYSMAQGIEDGFLANFLLHKVRLNIDKEGLQIEDALSKGAKLEIPEEAELQDLYKAEQFEKEIILPDRTAKICEHLASLLKTYGPMQKTIVFCVTMSHAGEVAKLMQNHFSDLGYPNYAIRIVSEESDSLALLKTFQDQTKDVPVVATTVDLLSTGFDAPTVQNIVFMKPISSPLVFKQIMGRGSRISKDKGKFWYRVIDYTNATRLIDEWIEGEPEVAPEGPRNNFLNGIVVEEELLTPIFNALLTIQLAPNEQIQARTDTEGKFLLSKLPDGKIKLYVSAEDYKRREITVETQPNLESPIQIELVPQKKRPAPITVRGLTVFVEDELMFEVEILGRRLTIKEYIDYSKSEIAKIALSADALRQKWIKPATREELLEQLESHGINANILAKIFNNSKADEYDLYAHTGFGADIHTREERARAVLNTQQKFLQTFTPEQQRIIRDLLLHYQENGINELTKADVFDIYPLPGYMQSQRIFGTAQKLRKSTEQLQEKIYIK